MDVLNNKFELPLSNEELRKNQTDARINIETSDESKIGTSFKDLKEIDVTNKVEKPIPSVRKEPEPTPTPPKEPEAKPTPLPTPTPTPITEASLPKPIATEEPKPTKASSTPKKKEDEDEEADPKGNPKNVVLQFNWTEPPPGLINMPNDASNLDMMRVGAGPENIQGAGQQRAWSILDIMDEEDDLFIFETMKGLFNRVEGNKTTQTFASAEGGIFRRTIDTEGNYQWSKVGDENEWGFPTRINTHNGSLIRTIVGLETGSPIDVYDIDEGIWSSLYGDMPPGFSGFHGDYIVNSCFHNEELYLASHYFVYKNTNGVWSKFNPNLIGGPHPENPLSTITDITSDGSNLFIATSMHRNGGLYSTELYTVTPSDYNLLTVLNDEESRFCTLDYENYTEKLYAGINNVPVAKVYRVDTDGTSEDLLTLDGRYEFTSAATGSLFGYLSAGPKIYRLGKDVAPTEIYSGDAYAGQRFLTSYEEQIGIGANGKIFHTEMEGSLVRAVRRGEDSKYPT